MHLFSTQEANKGLHCSLSTHSSSIVSAVDLETNKNKIKNNFYSTLASLATLTLFKALIFKVHKTFGTLTGFGLFLCTIGSGGGGTHRILRLTVIIFQTLSPNACCESIKIFFYVFFFFFIFNKILIFVLTRQTFLIFANEILFAYTDAFGAHGMFNRTTIISFTFGA